MNTSLDLLIDCRFLPEQAPATWKSIESFLLSRVNSERYRLGQVLVLFANEADRVYLPTSVTERAKSFVVSVGPSPSWSDFADFFTSPQAEPVLLFVEAGLILSSTSLSQLLKKKKAETLVQYPANLFVHTGEQIQLFSFETGVDVISSPYRTRIPYAFAVHTRMNREQMESTPIHRTTEIENVAEAIIQIFCTDRICTDKGTAIAVSGTAAFSVQGTQTLKTLKSGHRNNLMTSAVSLQRLETFLANHRSNEEVEKTRSIRAAPLFRDEYRALLLEAAQLDPRWSPDSDRRYRVHPMTIETGDEELPILNEAISVLRGCSDLFVLHQLRRGGAEREALIQMQSILEVDPTRTIAVVVTELSEPDWMDLLPKGVRFFHLGRALLKLKKSIDEPTQPISNGRGTDLDVLWLLMLSLKPSTIHFKASSLGWALLADRARELAQLSRLQVNLYCIDFQSHFDVDFGYSEHPVSFAFEILRKAGPYIDCLFADNEQLIQQLDGTHLCRQAKSLRYPVTMSSKARPPAPVRPRLALKPSRPSRFLWASRLSKQKDFPTLIALCWLFPEHEFHVFGEVSEEWPVSPKELERLNLKIWGGFDSIEEIDLSTFDAFIYTSRWDGMPNVLLEIGVRAIPIISQLTGGIPELLDKSNSFPGNTLQDLTDGLTEFLKDPDAAREKAMRLRTKILELHSWHEFNRKFNSLSASPSIEVSP